MHIPFILVGLLLIGVGVGNFIYERMRSSQNKVTMNILKEPAPNVTGTQNTGHVSDVVKAQGPRWNLEYASIYNEVKIAPDSNVAPDFDKMQLGDALSVVVQSSKQDEDGEVQVLLGSQVLGCLPKGKLRDMAVEYIGQEFQVDATLEEAEKEGQNIFITLCFPYRHTPNIKTCQLTGTAVEDFQKNIANCDYGTEISAMAYDMEEEKYLVSCDGAIGYLPQVAEKYIANGEINAIVSRIQQNEQGDSDVTIAIRPPLMGEFHA